jgi:hypothetical protein
MSRILPASSHAFLHGTETEKRKKKGKGKRRKKEIVEREKKLAGYSCDYR